VLQVTFSGESASVPTDVGDEEPSGIDLSTGFLEDLISGETWGIPNLFLVFIVIVLIVIFMVLT